MTVDAIHLEWLVAEVIRRLQKLAEVPESSSAPPAAPPAERTARDLVLDTRVVTLAAIERQLANVQRVLVRPGAVVTPSVKDDLRKRHIRLEFSTEPVVTSDKAAEELTVARCTRTTEAGLAASALTHPAGANVMMFDELGGAVCTLASIVGDSRRIGVLLTDEPLAAVCLANRCATARAAWVRDVAELREAIAAIAVNLLVVHPRTMTRETWPELLATFRLDLPRRCPSRLSGGSTRM
ncbi:MAG: hypothetical protein ACYC3X_23620 [Pirellulaceae bacterium]